MKTGLNKINYNITGYNIDSFIKLMHQKRVVLFDVKRDNLNIKFSIYEKDKRIVNRYIKNFKIIKTTNKIKQIPKFVLVNLGVILGVFLGCLFFLFSSNYTWRIEVFGLKDLSKQEIITVLKNNNVKVGKINLQSNEEIETILLNNYDRIAQVSVIKQGTAIIINLSEKLVYTEQIYEPIKAKYSGIITSLNIITGTTNVKVGDYVNAGDILVLPFNVTQDGTKVSVNPLAEIEAKIFITEKAELLKQETVYVRTGKLKEVYKYKLFNLNLFYGKNKNSFALFDCVVYNESVSKLIPFWRQVECYYELKPSIITHNFDTEKDNLINCSVAKAQQNVPIGELLDTETKLIIAEDKMLALTKITVQGLIND